MAIVEPEFAERGDWWTFERLSRWDPTHPAAAWSAHLLQEAALISLPCPRCSRVASVRTNLDHLLRDHHAGFGEAARWLEEADADLFALAVHYLATKERSSPSPARHPDVGAPRRRAAESRNPVEAESRPGSGLLPGWCRPRPRPAPRCTGGSSLPGHSCSASPPSGGTADTVDQI